MNYDYLMRQQALKACESQCKALEREYLEASYYTKQTRLKAFSDALKQYTHLKSEA